MMFRFERYIYRHIKPITISKKLAGQEKFSFEEQHTVPSIEKII